MIRSYLVTVDDKEGTYDFEAILDIGLEQCDLFGSDEFEITKIVEFTPTVGPGGQEDSE